MRLRIPIAAAAAALLVAGAASAAQTPQQPTQEELIAKREAKLALPFIEFGGWVTDYDRARELAREQDKPIFVYFSRSYAK
jgi:hypothetical protein